jgi:hypothetical protein
MTAINGVFRTVFSLLSHNAISAPRPVSERRPVVNHHQRQELQHVEDQEQVFLDSIAQLSADEKAKEMQRHLVYLHLAEQQGFSEVERRAEVLRRTDQ